MLDAPMDTTQTSEIQVIDMVLDLIDSLFRYGGFMAVDNMLHDVKTEHCSGDMLLSILTITLPAKDKLQNRVAYFERVRQALIHKGLRAKEADEVLLGLS